MRIAEDVMRSDKENASMEIERGLRWKAVDFKTAERKIRMKGTGMRGSRWASLLSIDESFTALPR
jgi:hypothetical protein